MLPKPYVPGALVGSVKAALRRSTAINLAPLVKVAIRGMLLDGGRRTLTFSGRQVAFTRQEWQLLAILVSHPDRFLSAREILSLGLASGPPELRRAETRDEACGPCRGAARTGH